MVTTTHTDDYLGLDLVSIDTDARDYMGRRTTSDRDYMGRLLHGGSAEPDPEALLAEADVRFDFSQYTDSEAMPDLNGSDWVLDLTPAGNSIEFTVDGLRLTKDPPASASMSTIGEVPSPLSFDAVGFTLMTVLDLADPTNNNFGSMNVATDGLGVFAPSYDSAWSFNVGGTQDRSRVHLYTTTQNIIDDASVSDRLVPEINFGVTGRFVHIGVVDVAGSEVRVARSSPAGRLDAVHGPFEAVPEFVASPTVIDTLNVFTPNISRDTTVVEWAAWNRALTAAEVDALISHFG